MANNFFTREQLNEIGLQGIYCEWKKVSSNLNVLNLNGVHCLDLGCDDEPYSVKSFREYHDADENTDYILAKIDARGEFGEPHSMTIGVEFEDGFFTQWSVVSAEYSGNAVLIRLLNETTQEDKYIAVVLTVDNKGNIIPELSEINAESVEETIEDDNQSSSIPEQDIIKDINSEYVLPYIDAWTSRSENPKGTPDDYIIKDAVLAERVLTAGGMSATRVSLLMKTGAMLWVDLIEGTGLLEDDYDILSCSTVPTMPTAFTVSYRHKTDGSVIVMSAWVDEKGKVNICKFDDKTFKVFTYWEKKRMIDDNMKQAASILLKEGKPKAERMLDINYLISVMFLNLFKITPPAYSL